jgi:outer membrane protein assembly factor BamA
LPRFNNDIPQPQSKDFAYQTLAANVRGFTRNIRNGNSFVLGNAELRVPIMKYLTTKPIQSSFWRNMQVVGFFDFGTAWTGASPFTDDNPINTVYVSSPPTVFVKVRYFRDPIVAGYGAGLRTSLFGYFLRADYAWGIETKVVQKPILYVSMGMDF